MLHMSMVQNVHLLQWRLRWGCFLQVDFSDGPGGKAALQPGAAGFDGSVAPPRWQQGEELV